MVFQYQPWAKLYILDKIDTLRMKYTVRYLEAPTSYPGWLITRKDNSSIHISQPHLIGKRFQLTGLTEANGRRTTLPSKARVDNDLRGEPALTYKMELYESVIGDIRHVVDNTRLSSLFAAARLCKHILHPTAHHMNLLKHLCYYLKRTSDHGILHCHYSLQILNIYVDINFAASKNRKSVRGILYFSFRELVA